MFEKTKINEKEAAVGPIFKIPENLSNSKATVVQISFKVLQS